MKVLCSVGIGVAPHIVTLSCLVGDDFDLAEILSKGLDGAQHFSVRHDLAIDGGVVGGFTFQTLPGCCGVVVSTSSWLKDKPWNLGQHFHKLKEKVARELGYAAMLSTTHCRNVQEVVGGAKAGWKWEHPFKNPRSGNEIFFGIKVL